MTGEILALLAIISLIVFIVMFSVVVVPQQSAFVVERAGRYHRTLVAGYHFLIPVLDAIRYKHSLKEVARDIPEQICITRDNVQVAVDGVLYLQIVDAHDASYGIDDYDFAITQLAQTTLRSEIGKIELDKTFEERTNINQEVVSELDKATDSWGIKVKRYEIKNITPPHDVLAAMEKQMRAEREKRATILASEAERDAAINVAEGRKQQVIKGSEATREKQINEAAGEADAILAIADATAAGITRIANAVANEGGLEALQFRLAERYIEQFGNIAKQSTSLVLPANVTDIGSMLALASSVLNPSNGIKKS